MLFLLFSIFSVSEYQIPNDFNFRVGTRNGWFGLKSRFDGESGYVRKINTKEDLVTLVSKRRDVPEVLFLSDALVNQDTFNLLNQKYEPHKFLVGIIVYTTDGTSETSTESKFPNKDQSCYESDFEWNPWGNGEQYKQYDYPILYPIPRVSEQLLEYLNQDGDKAGAYIKLRMQPRGNAQKCLKDDTCDVIGGLSMIGSFNDVLTGDGVWAIASMDAFGIAPYAQVGADYSISGFVALLGALQSLKNLDWENADRPLRFGFFDAEEIGYLGSDRFLTEIEDFKCNSWSNTSTHAQCQEPLRADLEFTEMKISEIQTVVEIKNVGLAQDDTKLYAHTMHKDTDKQFISQISSKVTAPLTITEVDETKTPGIPPSSTHSFIKHNPSIQHVVFTGHEAQFINKNVGKPSDNQYDPKYITNAATVTARTLASLCFDSISETDLNTITANETFITSVMQGFVGAYNDSQVLHEVFNTTSLATDHASIYSQLYNGYVYYLKQQLIERVLKDVVATNVTDVECSSDSDCASIFDKDQYCSTEGKCEQSLIRGHPAYSLAFEYDLEEYQFYIKRDNYPVMTEAVWQDTDFRYILLPSFWVGRICIGFGVALWLLLCIGGATFWNWNLKFLKK